jgi:hypothetical protein
MKKILFSIFALLLCAFALVSCGGTEAEKAVKALTVKDAAVNPEYSYHAVGGWGEWDPTDANKMTPTTVEAVKKWNPELGAKLEAAQPQYVAFFLLEMGTKAGGWDAKAMDGNQKKDYDGCFTVKVIKSKWDEDSEMYLKSQWVPDPKTAHTESLTENLFVPVWQEKVDDHGFSWADNSVVLSGAGQYILVFADYGKASNAETFGYGYGIVKVGDVTPAEDLLPTTLIDEEAEKAAAEAQQQENAGTAWGLCGSMTSWSDNGAVKDIPLAATEDEHVFSAEVEFAAGAEFKVRYQNSWDTNYGADGVADGSNISVAEAGTYVVTFNDETHAITVTKK